MIHSHQKLNLTALVASRSRLHHVLNNDLSEKRLALASDLSRSRLFSGAEDPLIRRCSSLFAAQTFRRGQRIMLQGDSERLVHLVAAGHIRISCLSDEGHEVSLAIVAPGGSVGEEALVGERRSVTGTALEDCRTLAASADQLAPIFNAEPVLAMNLARYTSFRYSEAAMALEESVQGRVRDRLLRALQRLAREYGISSNTGRQIILRLTHADIATFVASTRETVSLELGALTRIGSIYRARGTITVPDHDFDMSGHRTGRRRPRQPSPLKRRSREGAAKR